MIENWNNELAAAIKNSKILCMVVFKISGEPVFINRAMQLLFSNNPIESIINPTFNQLLEKSRNEQFNGILTIGSTDGISTSIEGSVIQKNGELLITGEIDALQLSRQNILLSKLNMEITNLQRALIKEKKLLDISKRELEAVNESQNFLLGAAAHDLRNPMANAYALSDFLAENLNDFSQDELIKYLNTIRDNTSYSLELLNSLLDHSAIQSGKIELETRETSYMDLLKYAIESNRIFADKKAIELQLDTDLNDYRIMLDPIRIKQALNNLLGNAIKFSPSGSVVRISISSKPESIQTSIIDQGPGMSADEVMNLFTPFKKGSNKPSGQETSTGLGLAITRRVVEMHDGQIEVKSEKGKGSTFILILKKHFSGKKKK